MHRPRSFWIAYHDPFYRSGVIDPNQSGSRPGIVITVPEMCTPDRSLFVGMSNLVPRSRSSIRAIRFAGNYGFAAKLGPVGWEVASKRIEKAIPPGITFGRGWVGDDESPNTLQPPVVTSSTSVTPPTSTAASSEQQTVDPASASHSAGPHPSIDSQSLPSMPCGSLPQVSVDQGEHAVEMKNSHNVHERAAKHQAVNGFNSVPGSVMFASTAQLVASRIQTHTAD
uniref:Uncharacterized protein n=1 Tax=Avena sativa TaxID=4498 RepID=A0ACD5XYY4_AVESA